MTKFQTEEIQNRQSANSILLSVAQGLAPDLTQRIKLVLSNDATAEQWWAAADLVKHALFEIHLGKCTPNDHRHRENDWLDLAFSYACQVWKIIEIRQGVSEGFLGQYRRAEGRAAPRAEVAAWLERRLTEEAADYGRRFERLMAAGGSTRA